MSNNYTCVCGFNLDIKYDDKLEQYCGCIDELDIFECEDTQFELIKEIKKSIRTKYEYLIRMSDKILSDSQKQKKSLLLENKKEITDEYST